MKLRSWKAAALGLLVLCAFQLFVLVTGAASTPEAVGVLNPARAEEMATHLSPDRSVGCLYLIAGGAESLPDGWVSCEGQALLKSEHPELFAILGDRHSDGALDAGHFALPDFRGVHAVDLGPAAFGPAIGLLSRFRVGGPLHWNLRTGYAPLVSAAVEMAETDAGEPLVTATELVLVVKAR